MCRTKICLEQIFASAPEGGEAQGCAEQKRRKMIPEEHRISYQQFECVNLHRGNSYVQKNYFYYINSIHLLCH